MKKFVLGVVIVFAFFMVLSILDNEKVQETMAGPKFIYYGDVKSITADKSSGTIYLTKYIDTAGATIEVNDNLTLHGDAAKHFPKGTVVGDKVKLSLVTQNGEKVVAGIDIITPGSR